MGTIHVIILPPGIYSKGNHNITYQKLVNRSKLRTFRTDGDIEIKSNVSLHKTEKGTYELSRVSKEELTTSAKDI